MVAKELASNMFIIFGNTGYGNYVRSKCVHLVWRVGALDVFFSS